MKAKKKSRGKNKGNAFEREICRQLSLWWTQHLPTPRDDVFWRTASSGGRATQRAKSGKQTKGHYGDVCASDPIGQPLLDMVTIELKRGYNHCTLHDLLDKPEGAVQQTYEKWIKQAQEESCLAGTKGWLIIHKRDRREPVVLMPSFLNGRGFSRGPSRENGRPVPLMVSIYHNKYDLWSHAILLAPFLDSHIPNSFAVCP